MLQLLDHEQDQVHRRNALTLIGNAALAEGRTGDAIAVLSQAPDLCEEPGASWHLATSLLNLGTALLQAARTAEASNLFARARSIYQALGDQHFTARILIQQGYAALADDQPDEAARPIGRAMQLSAQIGDAWSVADERRSPGGAAPALTPLAWRGRRSGGSSARPPISGSALPSSRRSARKQHPAVLDMNPAALADLPPGRRPRPLVWSADRTQAWQHEFQPGSPVPAPALAASRVDLVAVYVATPRPSPVMAWTRPRQRSSCGTRGATGCTSCTA